MNIALVLIDEVINKFTPNVISYIQGVINEMDSFGIVYFSREKGSDIPKEILISGTQYIINVTGYTSYFEITDSLQSLYKMHNWNSMFFLFDNISSRIAKRLSAVLKSAFIGECIGLSKNNNKLEYHRIAMNDMNVAKIISLNSKLEICILKSNMFSNNVYIYSNVKNIDVINIDTFNRKKRLDMTELSISNLEKIDIFNQNTILGIGNGVDYKTVYPILNNLNRKYNIGVGLTRKVKLMYPNSEFMQIGQSGLDITTNLYIALGISGASQHISGLKKAKLIISVNIDSEAEIFKYSNYIAVADANKVLINLYNLIKKKE